MAGSPSRFCRGVAARSRAGAEVRARDNLIYWNEANKRGHFAACQQPALFSEEVRAAFSSLR